MTSNAISRVSSTLTRPADTVTYAQNDLIASSTTAGSISVPTLTVPNRVQGLRYMIRRVILTTPKTTGMSAFQAFIEFWKDAPTFTNPDNGAYAVATGAASYLGRTTTTVMTQAADGGYCEGVPTTGVEIVLEGIPTVYWSLKEADATGFFPSSAQTFVLTAELIGV